AIGVAAPDEGIVGNVEIAGVRGVRIDATPYVLETRVLDDQALCSKLALVTCLDGHFGVAQRQVLEVQVTGAHDIEQDVVAGTIENGFAVASALDDDGLFCRTPLPEVVGAVEEQAQLARIAKAVV